MLASRFEERPLAISLAILVAALHLAPIIEKLVQVLPQDRLSGLSCPLQSKS